jgi:putative phosphoserine phosphatase/1-acylglycerol-3-phosphate O-acyltransferase
MSAQLRLPGSIAEIEASPKGPRVGAFFDLDGTLIAGYSANHVTRERLRRRDFSATELFRSLAVMIGSGVNEASFAELLDIAAAAWRGRAHEDLEEMGLRIFERGLKEQIYPEIRDIVEAHQRRGHTVVLTSSASEYQAEPVAHHLGIDDVLCNRFLMKDGVLTGEIKRPIVWGPGKANAVQVLAAERGIDLGRSYFYADGDEDLALMYLVGNPRPTNPRKHLAKVADNRGWPVLRFTSRGSVNLVRTLAGLSAGGPLAGLGVGLGVLRRDKRAGINFVFKNWIDVMLATSDVHVNVVGKENAWAQRPAVFIVNHKNTFDGLITMSVVEKDFTAVAKGEIGKMPVFGHIGRLMDVAFVDRSSSADAVAALKPVEDLARKGLSVLVAPEGTRVDDRQIAPFKKGAFRIAMETGLPIVPIVIRNADSLGGRGALAMHPATVDVAVLEPISVEEWSLEELPKRIEEVRQLFIDTLADWPADDASVSAISQATSRRKH